MLFTNICYRFVTYYLRIFVTDLLQVCFHVISLDVFCLKNITGISSCFCRYLKTSDSFYMQFYTFIQLHNPPDVCDIFCDVTEVISLCTAVRLSDAVV